MGEPPLPCQKSNNPAPPLSGNLLFFGCQETCFPKTQKNPALPIVPNHGRSPTSPLKSKNARFLTEGRKAAAYYSVSGTRRPASQGSEVQCSLCLTAPLSKSENTSFPTEGRKAVTFYFVDSTRRPDSQKCTEAQHFPPHQPTGESHIPCVRAETPATPLSGNLLLCN
jgi:hypothetical protein